MGNISMSARELRQYRLAMDVIEGKLSIKEFSLQIGKSYRQAQRIVKKIKLKGVKGAYHGNKGRSPVNKTPENLLKDVELLLKFKYREFNLTHFREMLETHEGIKLGKDTIHRLAKKKRLVKYPRKRVRRTFKSRPRLPREGMMIQFDGSNHVWFGDIRTDLIAGIDDATGKVLNAEFFHGEKSLHSMKVIKGIIENYGVPESFYMDQAGMYGKKDRDSNSQISRAFDQLGIQLILAGSSQAKGRIERLWRSFQDRLVAELGLYSIDTLEEANMFLKNDFLPRYNHQFSVAAEEQEITYRRNVFGDLDLILCKKIIRKVSPGNAFGWNGVHWLLQEKKSFAHREININEHINGSYSFDIMGRKVQAKVITSKKRYNIEKKAG